MDGLQWKTLWKWMIWGTPILGTPLTNHLLSGMYSHAETVWHVWRLLVLLVGARQLVMPSLWDDKFFNFPVVQGVSKVFAGVQFFTPKDYPKRGDPGLGRFIHV